MLDPDGNEIFLAITQENHATALNRFAATSQGKAFLSQFAKAGQTIGGVKFETTGKYAGRGINLSINSANMEGAYGNTRTFLTNSSKGNLNLRNVQVTSDLPKERNEYEVNISLDNDMSDDQSTYTLGHEAFVHGENNAEKVSNIEKDIESGVIDSPRKVISRMLGVTNTTEEHKNLKKEGTKEKSRMDNYVKELNKNETTTKYNDLYKSDKDKY